MDDGGLKDQETVVAYHERTKHHYHRFAATGSSTSPTA